MIEVIAVIFSLLSVILTVINNKYCWPVGIIGIVFYAILFYQNILWGNFILQFLFTGQSLLGWYNWNKEDKLYPTWIKNRIRLLTYSPIVYIPTLLFTLRFESVLPYLDSATTSLSIIAMFLLSYKKIEGWIFWIIVDIISVYMFYEIGLYLSTIVYFVFLILAITGLIKWSKYKRLVRYEKI